MIGFLFFLFGVLVTLGMCGLAAWTDFRGFRIPNIVSIVIASAFAVAFAVTWITGQDAIIFQSLTSHLLSFVIIFGATFAMFSLRMLGAGDAKMAAALSLWLGLPGLAGFLFYMTMTGGVLAALSLILKKYKPLKNPPVGTWLDAAQNGVNKLPYGIAIGVGATVAFFLLGYFSPARWAAMINL